jgi:hypothetical protein
VSFPTCVGDFKQTVVSVETTETPLVFNVLLPQHHSVPSFFIAQEVPFATAMDRISAVPVCPPPLFSVPPPPPFPPLLPVLDLLQAANNITAASMAEIAKRRFSWMLRIIRASREGFITCRQAAYIQVEKMLCFICESYPASSSVMMCPAL